MCSPINIVGKILFSAVVIVNLVTSAHAQRTRPVTVGDAIRMRRSPDGLVNRAIAHFSPDGKKFVAVLREGNLAQNTNEYSILLWQTKEVFHSPAPQLLLTMSSSSNRGAIQQLSWLDNETITFLGEHPNELQQLYELNLRTRAVTRATNHPTNLLSYSMTPSRAQMAFTAEEPVESIFDERARREGFVVSTQWLPYLLAAQKGGLYEYNSRLFYQSSTGLKHQIRTIGRVHYSESTPSLSPDGRYILISTLVAGVPENWLDYTGSDIRKLLTQKVPPGRPSFLRRYELIDTASGETRILLDSPAGVNGSEAVWCSDSHSVVIVGLYLPLDHTDGEERQKRQSMVFTIEAKVPAGETTVISNEDLRLLEWKAETNSLVLVPRKLSRVPDVESKIVFHKTGEQWEKV